MKLENMDDLASSPEDLTFDPSTHEPRESGDGDSGTDTRASPEATPISNEVKTASKKKASKIPVRQNTKKTNGPEPEVPIIEAPEEFRSTGRDDDNAAEALPPVENPSEPHSSDHVETVAMSALQQPQSEPTLGPSIAVGVAQCAQASGCSRASTAKVCVALDPANNDKNNISTTQRNKNLAWRFHNGRLVFDEVDDSSGSSSDDQELLSSKNLNKRINESRSRLKYLEQKLKKAGITDEDTHKYDDNQNLLLLDKEEFLPEAIENNDEDVVDFCQFDASKVASFPSSLAANSWELYDELEDDVSSEESPSPSPTQTILKMRDSPTSASKMGTEIERAKHNPDRDNLKSLLKRPGKSKDKARGGNRVVFNENKNEFFDADYIILIREECDYDDEDDDGVCTCNQHEMVRLTCCEPNCNCSVYDGYEQTPQSPKFAPPLEFVDAVTLSPPEGYKDLELEEQQLLVLQQMARRGQRTAVCRECSVTHDEDEEDDGEGSQSDNEACVESNSAHDKQEEKEKTDQSQQTTPTTPPNDDDSPNSQRYILETISMTTVTEQRILREAEEERRQPPNTNIPPGGSPINGILKGGRLWKQQSIDVNAVKAPEPQQVSDCSNASDEENSTRRSVRFIESEDSKRDTCDGAPDPSTTEESPDKGPLQTKDGDNCVNNSISPESTEMMLTFKLGNHVLISNNSLKPNSAVRQLFPCTKPLNGKEEESIHQYLVTAESLKAFEEAKRSKLPQIIQSGETDESIKRAIERNTLRRSLIRYEPRSKKNVQKTDNSLVERIKQLTCDVDDAINTNQEEINQRVSPSGEESSRDSPDVSNNLPNNRNIDNNKSFSSPSSSSTTSSNSSSMSSTYKKITDLFGKREKTIQEQQPTLDCNNKLPSLPDLGNGSSHLHEITDMNHCQVSKLNSASNESRKQFLSTLAPLTACVSGVGNADEYYYHNTINTAGERASVASSIGTEYSLEDIDEGLKNGEEESKKIAPDVLAGTPSASESGDELAMFVQQDASRIERIKKKYQPEQPSKEEDDEHDDYGFNRRPSVRGIKPRFGSTTEILQQIQSQIQPPTRIAWPYYSESGLTNVDNTKSRNINYQYPPNVPEDQLKGRSVAPAQYRPTSLQDENLYQNCANQRCVSREVYRVNGNQAYSSTVMKVGGGCNEYYQSLPRVRNGRPQSPPPLELSKNYHQTMVYIPYNHIEGYQPAPYYHQTNDYVRVSNQNQINKRYIEPIYQQRIHVDEHHYSTMLPPALPLKPVRVPLPQQHLIPSRSESPIPGQFSTARSTQTPHPNACNYYPNNPRYRPVWPPNDCNYVNKLPRHYPNPPRYPPPPDNLSLTDSDSQHSGQLPNGYFPEKTSPTKSRFLERGVPEGAASIPVQDSNSQNSSSSMTSPTSPQNPPNSNQKPMFYAMNV